MTPSRTSGRSKSFSRRRFLQHSLVAAFGLFAGLKENPANPTKPKVELVWTLKRVEGASYLRVQTSELVDRIEWQHQVTQQSDSMWWRSHTDASRQAEFLLGDLKGSIELRVYQAGALLKRQVIHIAKA